MINDELISKIFRAMVAYDPNLEIFFGHPFTIRHRISEILDALPLPVGEELRKLFTPEMINPNTGRLDQIFKTLESVLQFTSFVLLAQLLEESISKKITFTDDFKNNFKKFISKPSMGIYAGLIRSMGEIFTNNIIEPFMPEMSTIFNDKFYDKINFLISKRNQKSHNKMNLKEKEIENRCFEYQERLADILVDMTFYIKYPLVTIKDILVQKRKRKPAVYGHRIKMLNISLTGSNEKAECDIFTESHAVLLIKSLQNPPSSYLNLSPLIIDTYIDTQNPQKKTNTVNSDIFLYNSWESKHERLRYCGTEVTEECDLRCLPSYDRLVEEFKEYLTVFSNNGDSNNQTK